MLKFKFRPFAFSIYESCQVKRRSNGIGNNDSIKLQTVLLRTLCIIKSWLVDYGLSDILIIDLNISSTEIGQFVRTGKRSLWSLVEETYVSQKFSLIMQ